jgi:hypothetical protein
VTHRDARLAMVYPLALVLSAVDSSDVTLALLPLICTVLTASLVAWLACWFWGSAAGLCAGLLFAAFPLTISLSTFYVPEPMLGFEICLATYLTTEVGALMLPVYYLYLKIARRVVPRDWSLVAGFAVVWGAELMYHQVVHGSPLFRFTLTTDYLGDPMLVSMNSDLASRVLKTIPRMFIFPNPEFGILGPVLALAGVYGLVIGRQGALFVTWAVMVAISFCRSPHACLHRHACR